MSRGCLVLCELNAKDQKVKLVSRCKRVITMTKDHEEAEASYAANRCLARGKVARQVLIFPSEDARDSRWANLKVADSTTGRGIKAIDFVSIKSDSRCLNGERCPEVVSGKLKEDP
ncbi:hypothetical protein WN48_03059 [Eufriesea mexicana]|uniref:Uncharacterized protein n=1 Tax=Eufriesea mexicana TaxID=516756 RepID=A0A310SB31_9HYME|nr:hypothetical protein WN48_03059 [Eufriesea mexicana]